MVKAGFGEIVLGGDRLQRLVRQPGVERHHRGLVALERAVGEGIDLDEAEFHHDFPLPRRLTSVSTRGIAGVIDLALGIEMDQNLDAWKLIQKFGLDLVHHVMGVGDGHVGRDPGVELDEIAAAAAAGTEIVDALELRVVRGDFEEALALLLRPFLVHQLIDGVAGGAERAPGEVEGDGDAEHSVGAGDPDILVDDQGDDHRQVEPEVAAIVDIVGADRDRSGRGDHPLLVGEQSHGGEDRDDRDGDAELGIGSGLALHQRSTARQPMPTADKVISATWNRAASASALPWPKR